MKVDLGTCAACGAKNSKFVQNCYKCGAALPWSPDYVAPKTPAAPQSQPKTPAPKTPAPKAAAPVADAAKTVVAPPVDVAAISNDDAAKPTVAERAQKRVAVPAWAIGAGVLGCVALGIGLKSLTGAKTLPPAPIPAPTAALAPIVAPTTAAPVAPTVEATPLPTALPTQAPAPAPATVTTPPGVTPPGVTPLGEVGPTFDAFYENLHQGTAAQQQLYWESVKGKKIAWRGEFVSLGTAPQGPLKLRCKNGAKGMEVTVNLDSGQNPPAYTPNQSVAFEGVLSDYSPTTVEVSQGRIR